MPLPVKRPVNLAFPGTARLLLDVSLDPKLVGNEPAQIIRVMGRVRHHMADARKPLDQADRLRTSPRKRAARTRAETPALLKGLLYGPDGAAFSPSHTRKGGKLYRYYVSQTVLKHGAGTCPIGRVPAGEIEAAVIDQLRAVFSQPEIVAGTWKAAREHNGDITEADARTALQQLDPLWDELFPAEQARIVALLIDRIDIGTEGLDIRLRVDGLTSLAHEMPAGDMGAAA